MPDALNALERFGGVFLDRNCLFVSTTGKFLTGYVNCEVIFPSYHIVRELTSQLIAPFLPEVEGFVCPATGDIVLAQYATWLAHEAGCETTAVWADKHSADNSYHIERNGFEHAIERKRVLILNDRISQGGTTLKVIAEARRLGCDVLGVATLAGVTPATAEMLDVPRVHALCTIDIEAFAPNAIPDQYQGLPIAEDEVLGHGADYKLEHPDYPGGYIKLLG